jgi:hypothetical protein
MEPQNQPISLAERGNVTGDRDILESRIASQELGIAPIDALQGVELAASVLVRDRERSLGERALVHLAVSARDAEAEACARGQDLHRARN